MTCSGAKTGLLASLALDPHHMSQLRPNRPRARVLFVKSWSRCTLLSCRDGLGPWRDHGVWSQETWFVPQFCHLPTAWLWASQQTFLVRAPSEDYWADWMRHVVKQICKCLRLGWTVSVVTNVLEEEGQLGIKVSTKRVPGVKKA